jgi:Uma2 family endonuclease
MSRSEVAPPLVSEQEYLHSAYEPDCDYVQGILLERNVGERPHSILQRELIVYFANRRKEWRLIPFPEQRIRVGPGRYRIPDIAIYKDPAPREAVFTTPPFIAIEILSSEDRMSRIRQKISEYLQFGVRYVWVVDPATQKADVYTAGHFYEAADLVLRTSDPQIEVPLAELFKALSE